MDFCTMKGLVDRNKLAPTKEDLISAYNLKYVYDADMPIQRSRKGYIFEYFIFGKRLREKTHLKRIKDLVIPPAWNDVKITHLPNGHLQAIGRDSKSRKQYRYHSNWSKIRNRTKFNNMYFFGQELPKIRAKVDLDLNQIGWPQSKVVALIIRLMEETHIRIGSLQYAKRNATYGLTTLRKRHLDIYKDKMRFEFIGKKGKEHKVTVRNKKLIKLVGQCEEIPGWELFKYYDSDGNKRVMDSALVNQYIHNVTNPRFSAKDFRTWAASLIFFDTLYDFKKPISSKEKEKILLTSYDAVSKSLGNTRNVCRKYYVHPGIEEAYRSNKIFGYFKKLDFLKHEEMVGGHSPSEIVLLDLLKNLEGQ